MPMVRYTVQAPAGTPVPTEIIQAELAMIRCERDLPDCIEIDLQAIGLGKPMTPLWEQQGWRVIACPERPWRCSQPAGTGGGVIPFPKGGRR